MPNLPKPIEDEARKAAEKHVDAAIKTGLAAWWARADDTQKFAVAGLAAAAALGPLGQGILASLGILFGEPGIPSGKQFAAVFWLFAITLPVAAWLLVVVIFAGKGAFGGVLIGAGVASYIGGVLMASGGLPDQLGNFYCYAELATDGVHYERQCREFDLHGFTSQTYDRVGSPSGSPDVFRWALVYTADARGTVMVVASALAAFSAGALIRREMD